MDIDRIDRIQGSRSDNSKRDELRRSLDALQEPAYKLVNFAAFRANIGYPIAGPPITSMHVLAREYEDLLKPIMDDWTKVKQSELIRVNLTQ